MDLCAFLLFQKMSHLKIHTPNSTVKIKYIIVDILIKDVI
jgi:hypothetical protein